MSVGQLLYLCDVWFILVSCSEFIFGAESWKLTRYWSIIPRILDNLYSFQMLLNWKCSVWRVNLWYVSFQVFLVVTISIPRSMSNWYRELGDAIFFVLWDSAKCYTLIQLLSNRSTLLFLGCGVDIVWNRINLKLNIFLQQFMWT